MGERVYYDDDQDVLITSSRAQFGSRSFSIRGITSIEVVNIPPNTSGPVTMMVLGFLLGFSCGLAPLFGMIGNAKIATIILSLVFIGMGGILMITGYWNYSRLQDRYTIWIVSAAGEREAWSSFDQSEINDIEDALDRAISDHS